MPQWPKLARSVFLLRIRAIVEPHNQGNEDSSFSETSGAWTQCSAKLTQVHHDRKEIERQAICKQQEQRNKNELVINTMRVGTKSFRNHGAHACGRQLHNRLVSVVQATQLAGASSSAIPSRVLQIAGETSGHFHSMFGKGRKGESRAAARSAFLLGGSIKRRRGALFSTTVDQRRRGAPQFMNRNLKQRRGAPFFSRGTQEVARSAWLRVKSNGGAQRRFFFFFRKVNEAARSAVFFSCATLYERSV